MDSFSRASSTARLQSSPNASGSGITSRQAPTPGQPNGNSNTPLAGTEGPGSISGPGQSALAAALQSAYGRSPPSFGTPPRLDTSHLRPKSPATAGATYLKSGPQSTYGSFEGRSVQGLQGLPPAPNENPEVVKRHLVQPHDPDAAHEPSLPSHKPSTSSLSRSRQLGTVAGVGNDEFSSLQLQGGDMTREVYRWTEEAESQSLLGGRGKRSRSFDVFRPEPEGDELDISSIKVPGGFRRNYLIRRAPSFSADSRGSRHDFIDPSAPARPRPRLLTKSFIEFLTVYGHFAGEELEEDDEDFMADGSFTSHSYHSADLFGPAGSDEEDGGAGEGSALLTPGTPARRKRKTKVPGSGGENTPFGAALLLLKSFVGTGVLFLPRAYLNGGMMFSNLVLLGVAMLSYYCFILLVNTRLKVEGSFGDIGGILYGRWLRILILSSVALSQLGFVSAYIVFTSENLQAFVLAVSHCRQWIDIKAMVFMQLIVFLPLSLIRDIGKLGGTALVADFFILLGLVYLYYYDILTLAQNHGVADIVNFNPRDWTLFIGTAIFTFEGVGLIIPIQESMKKPSEFPRVLAGVMIIITVVFISMGALSYAAFGSSTKTVILLNLPQDNKFVNAVQFLYSLAILLSTPLQLFPAIRIMETGLFTRSGKFNPYIKWKKNVFRFVLVIVCALIAWGGAGDLDKFVALVGSFACIPLVYVYPVSFLALLAGSVTFANRNHCKPLLHLEAVATRGWQRVTDIALCCFGAVVMVYTTALTIQSWAGGSSAKSPGYCDG